MNTGQSLDIIIYVEPKESIGACLLFCLDEFCLHLSMCTTCAWLPVEARKGITSLGIGVTVHCEPLCGRWEPNASPQQEQQVLLTTGPSLQQQMMLYL